MSKSWLIYKYCFFFPTLVNQPSFSSTLYSPKYTPPQYFSPGETDLYFPVNTPLPRAFPGETDLYFPVNTPLPRAFPGETDLYFSVNTPSPCFPWGKQWPFSQKFLQFLVRFSVKNFVREILPAFHKRIRSLFNLKISLTRNSSLAKV